MGIDFVAGLLDRVMPHQIYAAGDLSDPHGTCRVPLASVFQALESLADRDWVKPCEVWLYRGAWQEWEPHEIKIAVPDHQKQKYRLKVTAHHNHA